MGGGRGGGAACWGGGRPACEWRCRRAWSPARRGGLARGGGGRPVRGAPGGERGRRRVRRGGAEGRRVGRARWTTARRRAGCADRRRSGDRGREHVGRIAAA